MDREFRSDTLRIVFIRFFAIAVLACWGSIPELSVAAGPRGSATPRLLTRCKLLTHPGEYYSFGADASKKAVLRHMEGLIPGATLERVRGFYDSLTRAQRNNFTPALYEKILSDFEQVLTPSSGIHKIFPSTASVGAKLEILMKNYLMALDDASPLKDRAAHFVDWIRSDDQAFYAYDLLIRVVYGREKALINRVLDDSKFYSGVFRQLDDPALIITTSMEKETHSSVIASFFKYDNYTDEEWMRLPETTRFKRLRKREGSIKKTDACPEDLANLTWEMLAQNGGYMPEIKSASYNLTPAKTLAQIEKYAKLTGETHSFHLHDVFHVPLEDENYYSAFIGWYERLNTYLYFKGIEERLFSGPHVRGLDWEKIDPSKMGSAQMFRDLFSDFSPSFKFHSAGLRAGIYGESFLNGYKKIGLELRDVSRNLSTLQEIELKLAQAISSQVWFKKNYTEKGLFRLSREIDGVFTPDQISRFANRIGISADRAEKLMRTDPQILVPLIDYKNRVYLKQSASGSELSAAQIQRIESAQLKYEKNLKKLNADMDAVLAKGNLSEDDWENARLVIRWEIADWAQEARVSELFNPFL